MPDTVILSGVFCKNAAYKSIMILAYKIKIYCSAKNIDTALYFVYTIVTIYNILLSKVQIEYNGHCDWWILATNAREQ